ncbi:helix-turn-helix transcriptional regulator [Streptococcus sobrinus]|uniref:helix-turn-helix transcriptional regulator n=1 Tax=Streptococcus sobrinus TaxID=1310 RepID=UPI000314FDFE|nr:transcriptional regulator [Streptococcus sobrinus]OZV23148.1 transcriptional regulator [Streptococcus sobrinus]
MRIQRLIGLLCVLADVEKITVQQLADRFEVSKRTIFRDLDTLNLAGIPIISYPGIGGGVSIIEGYKIDKKILSTDDTRKIFTALKGLKSIENDNSYNSLIAKLIPKQGKEIFLYSEYIINFSSWFDDSVIHEKAIILHKAICNRQCVSLEYVSKKSREKRIVEPYKLIFKQSDWYLYAFCRNRNDFRLFKLKRIISYELLENFFEQQQISDICFEKNYAKDLFSKQYKKGFIKVVLEYDLKDEFEITQKIDASFFQEISNQTDTGQICFYTSSLPSVSNLVFEMLDKVRVISPPELYNDIICRLKNANRFYKG